VDDLDRVDQRFGGDGQNGEGRITFAGGSVKPAHGREIRPRCRIGPHAGSSLVGHRAAIGGSTVSLTT
jgi:hypothetical protein